METIITREDDSSRIVEMVRQCNFGEIQSYGPVSVIPADDLRLKNGVSHGNALLADETVVHFVGFGPQILEN